jgi:putative nucleotidyltransferase with HDIG domain
MTTELAQKLEGVRDFKKILETVVKELGETYSADVSQIVLSNPLDRNLTSICEYKLYPEADAAMMPVSKSFQLPLQGTGLGTVNLCRQTDFHENEINWIRITLAELCDVIRHAQINDVVQRDTFRSTFLSEIQNVMQYSLGLGDALFMVVNILGKVLNVSRCLFICVDDSQAGFKCYEFWQRERVSSCQDYGWPTTDSPIVARSLLASSPMMVEEANQNSYLSPVQEELQLLGVRSLLGVPLRSESATHGCVILQHCESRHQWTRGELDMIQSVADTVAEALSKLPDEKKKAESKVLTDPILRLHQREVVDTTGGDKEKSILAVRRALRQSLGQASIPSASKTSAPKPPVPAAHQVAPAPTPTPPPPTPVQTAPTPTPTPTPPAQQPAAMTPPSPTVDPVVAAQENADVMATIGHLANSLMTQATGDIKAADIAAQMSSLMAPSAKADAPPTTVPANFSEAAQAPGESPWGDLDSIPTPPSNAGVANPAAPDAGAMPTKSPWGDLDAIPTPAANGAAPAAQPQPAASGTNGGGDGAWGNLDAIPTPSSGPAKGLGASMFGRRNTGGGSSPLMASLHRDKSRFQTQLEYVDGGEIQIDEAQAQAKIQQIVQQSSGNPTAEYINTITTLDPRMLARIEAWISQVEEKDRYGTPHAMAVAEYSTAIARLIGLPAPEIETVKLAAILHDVGKMGLPANILQKPETQLEDTELLWKMKHPIDGANLLEGFPEVANLAPIILAHHEEYNGNGYPAGLAGDQIPLAARIIHVASDYHGMISPMRGGGAPAMTPDQAHQALRQNAGSNYDPQIVEALIACEAQGLVTAAR